MNDSAARIEPTERYIKVADFKEALERWKTAKPNLSFKLGGGLEVRDVDFLNEVPFQTLLEFANIGANVVRARNNPGFCPRIGTPREQDCG